MIHPSLQFARTEEDFSKHTSGTDIVADIVAQRIAVMENFITIYLHETGAKLADTVVVEQKSDDGRTTTFWCEPKGQR